MHAARSDVLQPGSHLIIRVTPCDRILRGREGDAGTLISVAPHTCVPPIGSTFNFRARNDSVSSTANRIAP
eukprot:9438291-Alexandrium_andersonii.AAC.1